MQQQIQIDAHPHQGQAEVHRHPARFKILASGRRWGKTRLGVNECLDTAGRGGRAWWVAPTYKMSEVGWRPLKRIAGQVGAEIRQVDRQIILPGGGEVTVRSADQPDSLRGEGLDYLVCDECAFTKEEAWTEALRPALSDRRGKALFISTPKGRNWFWRLWQRGQEQGDEYKSWTFPTMSNPYIDPVEISAARQSLPDRIFRQEYLAEFIDDSGFVFRRVTENATAAEARPDPGQRYVYGVDWGKHNDYTVIVVIDPDAKTQVYFDRFNQIDYSLQTGRLKALCEQYKPQAIIAERNSMGDPLVEQLQRDGLPVKPFTTTNASKAEAIEALALAFERDDITIMSEPVLINELQAFDAKRLPSGLLRYEAPAGMHDDAVMALALAWQGCNTPPPAGATGDIDYDSTYKPERRGRLWQS